MTEIKLNSNTGNCPSSKYLTYDRDKT
jgi:hypothetical protein